MGDPRIVTPQEAQAALNATDAASGPVSTWRRFAETIATESDRINVAVAQGYEAGYECGLEDGDADASRGEADRTRAAVVKALRHAVQNYWGCEPDQIRLLADAIEKGADYA